MTLRARREERIEKNQRRAAKATAQIDVGERRRADEVKFLCECGRADCAASIALKPSDYEAVHSDPECHVVAPGSEHIYHAIEREQDPLIDTGGHWKLVRTWRPDAHPELDTETLKLERDALETTNATIRSDILSLASQVNTATASAAVVLGVFGAVRPADDSVFSGLFLFALVPFVAIVWLALKTFDATSAIRHALNPFAEDDGRRTLSIASYEQVERRDEAFRAAGPYPMPRVLLREKDWLTFELDRLLDHNRPLSDLHEQVLGRRQQVASLLGLLVVYLGIATAVAHLA